MTASGYRTIFRTYFSIEDRVPLMLDLLAEQGTRRLAIFDPKRYLGASARLTRQVVADARAVLGQS